MVSWTKEREALLRKLWDEGESASAIARELGGITRNAVIGKIHRLGLSKDRGAVVSAPEQSNSEPAPPKRKATRKKKNTAPIPETKTTQASERTAHHPASVWGRKKDPSPPSVDADDAMRSEQARALERTSKRISLVELTEKTCRWPTGDPATGEFWFCGLPADGTRRSGLKSPYCRAHTEIAYKPPDQYRGIRRRRQ